MKIAINTLALYKTKAGMGKYIVELVNRIPEKDAKNIYLIYVSEENKHFFNVSRQNIMMKKIPRIFSHPLLKILWEQLFLPFSLQKNNVDIYHAPGFVLPILKAKKTRYVMTVADMTFFSHPQYHTPLKQFYFKYFIPSSIKKADKVIAISENTKKDIIKKVGISPHKIQTIYLGVDCIFTKKQKNEYPPFLKKYNITFPYILFVGMLEPRKNIEGLIKAFSLVKRGKHKLVIVGKKGWLYQGIFALIKRLHLQNEVVFTGYVPDEELPHFYSAATCFVYPSFYEGFGIPVLEAMACGCPVITSNNSSMQEIAGAAAVLIDPYKIETIKEAIESCITDKKFCEKMIELGFLQAKRFQWESMAKETISLYNSLETRK